MQNLTSCLGVGGLRGINSVVYSIGPLLNMEAKGKGPD